MKPSYGSAKACLLAIILLFGIHEISSAQLFKKLKQVVKQTASETVQDRAASAAGNATNNALDQTGKLGGLFKKGEKNNNSNNNKKNSTKDLNGASGTTGAPIKVSMTAYENYDFVPGDTVLFADDFSTDQDGEFPSHWDLKKGQAVVNKVANTTAFLLTDGNYCQVMPRMKTPDYLSQAFTIEFDTYTDGEGNESPIVYLSYMDKNGNSEEGEISFNRGSEEGDRGDLSMSNFPNGLDADFPEKLKAGYINKWHHCAIIYHNGQLKCYVDQFRVISVPNIGCTPTAFGFEGIGQQDHPIVIANVRLASGGKMNMIGKKFTASKIVTHGITFDVDKADIKAQSMGTLNMIVKIMKDNPDLHFEIDGHTDNTGQPAHNQTLSLDRATAVKTQLVKMGIDGSRLTTKGFGDTRPISDNDSQEGKANNRRVEFIRK